MNTTTKKVCRKEGCTRPICQMPHCENHIDEGKYCEPCQWVKEHELEATKGDK